MITVEHLTKRYGDCLAVDDLSFTIEDGHVYGFLGPNGAGKSTTLNIMTGCLAATSGTVRINDFDIYENEKEAKKMLGYLPEIPPLYPEQTPREYLRFVAEAKGIAKDDIQREIEKVINETQIVEVADRLIKHLSKGYRQRVGIAQALLGNPPVIILDEPTVGLDPMQILEIRDLVRELGESHTVILSSHILTEVQAICEKVLIIYKGKLIAFDAPEYLSKALSSGTAIEITAETDSATVLAMFDRLNCITKLEVKKEDERCCEVVLSTSVEDPLDLCRDIFVLFASEGKVLLQMNVVKTNLENIFMELTTASEEQEESEPEAEDGEVEKDESSI